MIVSSRSRFKTYLPTRITASAGAAEKVARFAADAGIRKAILLSDRGLAPLAEKIAGLLGPVHACTFLDVEPDTGVAIIDAAAELARKHGADGVVSLGGGSVIDTGKGVAVALKKGGSVRPWIGTNTLKGEPVVPHLVLPTTAGTGSEVTPAAVVKDGHVKLILWDDAVYPAACILDPLLTVKLPPTLTAATGMDALTHAIEAIHSVSSSPVTDALALHAIELIGDNLRECVHHGANLDARMSLLVASNLAGQAIANAFLGSVHALAHSVGAHARVHHGTANAIILPHVMKQNLAKGPAACAGRYALVGRSLKVPAGSDEEMALRAIQRIEAMLREIALPQRLRDAGVRSDQKNAIIAGALDDISHKSNPLTMTPELFGELFDAAW